MDNYQTTIPTELIDQKKLDGLIDAMSGLYQAKATVSTHFVIETTSAELSEIFDNIAITLEMRKPKKAEDKVRKRAQEWDAEIAALAKPAVAVETLRQAQRGAKKAKK